MAAGIQGDFKGFGRNMAEKDTQVTQPEGLDCHNVFL
jgi:hypothetical protein